MRARLSLAQAWLVGIGAFGAMTASFCLALSIAISGPPTPSETASFQQASLTALHRVEHESLRAASRLCRHLPRGFNDTVMCDARHQEVARAEPVRAPKPTPPPKTKPASPPAMEAVQVVAHERARIETPRVQVRPQRRPTRVAHIAPYSAHAARPARRAVVADAHHRGAHVVAARAPARPPPTRVVRATTPHQIAAQARARVAALPAAAAQGLTQTNRLAASLPDEAPEVNERILPSDEPPPDSDDSASDDSAPPKDPDNQKL